MDTNHGSTGGLPPLSRRGFLAGLAATSLAFAAHAASGAPTAAAASAGTVLPLVAGLPAGAPDRGAFAPNEQVYASYLLILAPLANSVVDDDPATYGWLADGWQRTPNEPFNARVMEHVATLSFFLATERPWNPYFRDPALAGRLDAALGHYLGLQHSDGAWPERRLDEHGLAPTGFGTVALSAVLSDLQRINALPARRAQIEQALRLGAQWLTDMSKPHWAAPINVTNQVVAGLAGVAQTSHVLGDPAIGAALDDGCAYLLQHGQPQAGFFNDPLTYDAGYNFEVMLPDLGDIYEATGNLSVVEMVRRWAEWFGYAVVMEPGKPWGFHYGGISGRNAQAAFVPAVDDAGDRVALGRAFLAEVPALGAFYAPAEDKQAARAAWAASTAPAPPRKKMDSSPRLYMHVPRAPDGVPRAERDAQLAQLPYVRADTFTEMRLGTVDQQFLFVRRPSYYLGALYGVRPSNLQRFGPGMFWHPVAGMVVLAVNGPADPAWSTVTAAGVDSAWTAVVATHHAGADASGQQIAPADVTGQAGVFTTRYTAGLGAIVSDVTYWHDGVVRAVATSGAAREQLPLVLQAQDSLTFSDGTTAAPGSTTQTTASSIALVRGGHRFQIGWDGERTVVLKPTGRTTFSDKSRAHHVLEVHHDGTLQLDVTAIDLSTLGGDGVQVARTAVRTGSEVAFHAVNLEPVAVDVSVMGLGGRRDYDQVEPGQGVYDLIPLPNGTTRKVVVQVRVPGTGGPRVTTTHITV